MPALQTQPNLITLEQYETLPTDKRVEVFEGIIYEDLFINFAEIAALLNI